MKTNNIFSVIGIVIILFSCLSCSINDIGDEFTNEKSYVKIELAGPLKNGVFKIETENAASNFHHATGLFVQNTETMVETALLTFQDETADLSIAFAFPAEKGLNELVFDEIDEYISITFLSEELFLASQLVSLNISQFEKKEIPFLGLAGTFKAKGSFTGTVVYIDAATNTEYSHILTGEFEYNPI